MQENFPAMKHESVRGRGGQSLQILHRSLPGFLRKKSHIEPGEIGALSLREGIVPHNFGHFPGGAQEDGHRKTEFAMNSLPDLPFERALRPRGRVEDDIAALDVGSGVGEAEAFEQSAQPLHGNGFLPAHIDSPQQRNPNRHGARLARGEAPLKPPNRLVSPDVNWRDGLVPDTLNRRLGLFQLLTISVGGIIGSAWLFAPLFAAQAAGPGALLSWLISGGAAFLLALVYAELGAAFPVAGGLARFSYFSHGNLAGFIAGAACWLGYVAIAPIEVQAMIRYLSDDAPWMMGANGSLSYPGIAAAALLLLAMSAINLLGVQWFGEANKYVTIWKMIIPVLIPVVLLFHAMHPENFTAAGGFLPYGWNGVFAAVSTGGTMFAMLGFRTAIEMAGESRNPQRDLPFALAGSVLITVAIYLLIQIGFLGALPSKSLAHGWAGLSSHVQAGPFVELAAAAGLIWLVRLIFADSVVSPAGCGLVFSGAAARLSYAMAKNGQLPSSFGRLNGKGVPAYAIWVNFLVGLVFFAPSQTWQTIVSFISSIQILSLAFGPPSLLALRRTAPAAARPFRVPAAGLFCSAAFAIANIIVYWCGWETNRVSLGLLAAFGIFFVAAKRLTAPREPLDLSGLAWLLPYGAGLAALSALGNYGSGARVLPAGWDLAMVAAFSLAILALSIRASMPRLPAEAERGDGVRI